jgi:hypothetical protein
MAWEHAGHQQHPLEAARLWALAMAQGHIRAKNNLGNLMKDRSKARQVQDGLKRLGHYTAAVDRSFGPASRAALKAYCDCAF